jgi:hypothetical protein
LNFHLTIQFQIFAFPFPFFFFFFFLNGQKFSKIKMSTLAQTAATGDKENAFISSAKVFGTESKSHKSFGPRDRRRRAPPVGRTNTGESRRNG